VSIAFNQKRAHNHPIRLRNIDRPMIHHSSAGDVFQQLFARNRPACFPVNRDGVRIAQPNSCDGEDGPGFSIAKLITNVNAHDVALVCCGIAFIMRLLLREVKNKIVTIYAVLKRQHAPTRMPLAGR
jgi:hypothetical protein